MSALPACLPQVMVRRPVEGTSHTDDYLRQVLHVRCGNVQRRTVVYMLVSSNAQKPDLANQRTVLESFCAVRGLAVDEWIEQIGGG